MGFPKQLSETRWTTEAPAKINLFLEVLCKRSDGFHDIVSVAVPIRLFDRLTFEFTDDPAIRFECVHGGNDVPTDETNLVVKAARLVKQRYGVPYGAAIQLTKSIPSQAGLGGGSSDASAALCLACRIWNLDIADSELLAIASELGSDCPIFFYDVPTISTGRGEQIKPLKPIRPISLILLKPQEGLSTPKIFAKCMPLHDGTLRQPEGLLAALQSGDVQKIGEHLFNRLEVPVQNIWYRFEEIKTMLLSAGCLAVQMSGSGSAFFGLCSDDSHGKDILRQLQDVLPTSDKAFLVQTY